MRLFSFSLVAHSYALRIMCISFWSASDFKVFTQCAPQTPWFLGKNHIFGKFTFLENLHVWKIHTWKLFLLHKNNFFIQLGSGFLAVVFSQLAVFSTGISFFYRKKYVLLYKAKNYRSNKNTNLFEKVCNVHSLATHYSAYEVFLLGFELLDTFANDR